MRLLAIWGRGAGVRQAQNTGRDQLEWRGLLVRPADPGPFGSAARRETRDLTGGRPGLLEPGQLALYALSNGEGPFQVCRPAHVGDLGEASESITERGEHLLDRVLDER